MDVDEGVPYIVLVFSGGLEDGPEDECGRCGVALVDERWTIDSSDGDLHQLHWLACGECFQELAKTWWSSSSASCSTSSPDVPSPGGAFVHLD